MKKTQARFCIITLYMKPCICVSIRLYIYISKYLHGAPGDGGPTASLGSAFFRIGIQCLGACPDDWGLPGTNGARLGPSRGRLGTIRVYEVLLIGGRLAALAACKSPRCCTARQSCSWFCRALPVSFHKCRACILGSLYEGFHYVGSISGAPDV